jgi:hypothetical protein
MNSWVENKPLYDQYVIKAEILPIIIYFFSVETFE